MQNEQKSFNRNFTRTARDRAVRSKILFLRIHKQPSTMELFAWLQSQVTKWILFFNKIINPRPIAPKIISRSFFFSLKIFHFRFNVIRWSRRPIFSKNEVPHTSIVFCRFKFILKCKTAFVSIVPRITRHPVYPNWLTKLIIDSDRVCA